MKESEKLLAKCRSHIKESYPSVDPMNVVIDTIVNEGPLRKVYLKPADVISPGGIYITYIAEFEADTFRRVYYFRSRRRDDGMGDDTLP